MEINCYEELLIHLTGSTMLDKRTLFSDEGELLKNPNRLAETRNPLIDKALRRFLTTLSGEKEGKTALNMEDGGKDHWKPEKSRVLGTSRNNK